MFLHFANFSGAESIEGGVPSSRNNHFCAVHAFALAACLCVSLLGWVWVERRTRHLLGQSLLRHACPLHFPWRPPCGAYTL